MFGFALGAAPLTTSSFSGEHLSARGLILSTAISFPYFDDHLSKRRIENVLPTTDTTNILTIKNINTNDIILKYEIGNSISMQLNENKVILTLDQNYIT